ncbi:hypothetical protein HN371_15660 [Candidatus Poribacteria bacterium]|nr:hypothetical protein [Candidatus Poribacteria bacterium]MBT5533063.1 hypothetical protein [Candidatus Poribacteria bacterium]MBT5709726.1 hypothetical protein [Candidatus Poribacteria bacterium]MBT7101579.1 hypothetical protein [Candidatus Poribacteria bacterium]MBT7808865.1 hypothetical protein [Candidatus Poribacteria bacterium]
MNICVLLGVALLSAVASANDGATSLIDRTLVDPEYDEYPHFRQHALTILQRKVSETRPLDVNPYVAELLGGSGRPSVELHADDVEEFFVAAAADELTIVRAMGFVARAVRETRVLTYLNGEHARDVVRHFGLDVGLAVPMSHLLLFAYIPVDAGADDEVQCRFLAVYGAQYEHRFHRDVLNATLKVGTGRDVPYLDPWDDGAEIKTAYIVEGRIMYGGAGVGYVDVSGIGGRKHGLLGVMQKVFFFLPDAIGGMVVRDGDLYVNAIMNQRVEGFESALRYAVHYRDGMLIAPDGPPAP